MKPQKPVQRKDRQSRKMARLIRDRQWEFMERCARHNPLWFCCWNKLRLPEAADELRSCLMSGMDYNDWIQRHRSWFRLGKWDDKRYAMPIRLTALGRRALKEREKYDMEPVFYGLVEPGYISIPAEHTAAVRPLLTPAEKGARAALNARESLCPEDFPTAAVVKGMSGVKLSDLRPRPPLETKCRVEVGAI